MKTTSPQIGSISHGTMRPEDLIPDFAYVLAHLDPENPIIKEANDWSNVDTDSLSEDETTDHNDIGNDILESLFDHLNNHAPAFCYFGSHPGDCSDYGFWPCEDFQQMAEDDDIPWTDGEPESDYVGEWFHVNDHGNVTLYLRENGLDREIWAIV